MFKVEEARQIFKQVFETEINSLKNIVHELDDSFLNALKIIQDCQGRVIVIGMGKSGHIGKKIAATFASTGTSSFFVHPAEAFHGDLGMIRPKDIVMLISYSGETEELIRLLPFLQWQKNKTIAVTGYMESTLARNCDVVLSVKVEREACNNNLAPTSSTTATLVMGDALAVTISTLNNFRPEDFARFHPGGSLGRKLLTKVKDVMHKKNIPICSPEAKFLDVVKTMSNGRLGLTLIMEENKLSGIITDGDLRRALEKFETPTNLLARDFMSVSPKTVSENEMFNAAEIKMRELKIGSLVVINDQNLPTGILQVYDVV